MRVIVWGCGDYGKMILPNTAVRPDIQILAYADSNEKLWGTEYCHIPIVVPEEALRMEFDMVFVAVSNFRDKDWVIQKLRNFGVPQEKIVDIISDKSYMELYMNQRFRWMRDYAAWIYKNHIRGNVAECGVFRGDSAKFINRFFSDRILYLCDTFEGFSQDDLKYEFERGNEYFNESRFADRALFAETSIERILQKMSSPENVVIKKGYFPDSARDIEDTFCFVNLDMDLYVPMLNGIRFFWDKLEKNCCILLHDYFALEFSGVQQAVDTFEKERNLSILKTPIGDGSSLALWKTMET